MRPDIQEEGAVCARAGLSLWDCPYYRAIAIAGHVPDTLTERRLKIRAWELGWLSEGSLLKLSDSALLRAFKGGEELSWQVLKNSGGPAQCP